MRKISIIVPLHNKGPYISETIQSVINQSIDDWEMIVVENGSTDDGPKIVSNCGDLRVRLIVAPQSIRGPGAARNVGLDNALGDWLLFLDADDLLESNHLENLMSVALDTDGDIAVSGWCEFHDGFPEQYESKEPMGRGKLNFCLSDQAIAFAPWAVHCALVRRSCFNKKNHWQPELDSVVSEDTAFWFRLLVDYTVAYSLKNSALYRVETTNSRNQHDDLPLWFSSMKAVIHANLEFLESRNQKPNAAQCENLMRLWANIAERAIAAKELMIEESAITQSQHWMDECSKLGGINTFSLILRKGLGIHAFQKLKMINSLVRNS